METLFAVLTALGTDRVGIADDIAEILEQESFNIEESRMAVLGGEFAIILLFSGAAEAISHLQSRSEVIGQKLNLKIDIKETQKSDLSHAGLPYILESTSLDSSGIVHAITALLRNKGISIESLETEARPAPLTGSPMFFIRASLLLPRGASVKQLRKNLEELEQDHDLDITLKASALI